MDRIIIVPIIMSRNSGVITLMFPTGAVLITDSHQNRDKIMEKIFPNGEDETQECIQPLKLNEDELKELINLTDLNKVLSTKGFTVNSNKVYYANNELTGVLERKVKSLLKSGKDLKYLSNFLDKLYQNSNYVREQLYGFLENNNFVINENGNFYAYKYVTSDYKDYYTKAIDNSPGAIVEMPRYKVNSDPHVTCSTGLHACSYSYLGDMGMDSNTTIIMVEIDPRDVVSIPVDYNNAKMRCCKYTVVEDIRKKMTNVKVNNSQKQSNDILLNAETIEDLDNDIDKLIQIFSNDARLSKRISNGIIKNKTTAELIASCFKARPKSAKARELYIKYGHIEVK